MQTKTDIGVLLMAYGSPESLDELEPYLLDIRNGRPVSPALLSEMKKRYALIGGRSPLLELTRAQALALETKLNSLPETNGIRFRTYVGMRHWQPRIRDAVIQMDADGIRRIIAIVMAPHGSKLSTGAYFERLNEAIEGTGVRMEVHRIESWYEHPGLISALAEKVLKALPLFNPIEPYILFTAHSLPARILDQGDPYDTQLKRTANLLAERLNLPADRWGFSYQSAGQSPEPWLGPSIDRRIPELIQAGYQNLLIVPIGFVCDHVEVLYDIDIAARALAKAHNAHLERTESLNTSPTLIAALADIVIKSLPVPIQK